MQYKKIIFIILVLIIAFQLFQNPFGIGGSDWDTHLLYNAVPRETIVQYKQFPLWNPYECGGTSLLGHPESLFISPFFILVLLFGVAIGVKLQILVGVIIGFIGMYRLLRYLKFSDTASFVSGLVLVLSSVYPLHLVMGHTLWLSTAFIPLAYLFYLKSFKEIKYCIGTSIMLVLMFFSGSTYLFAFTVLFLGIDSLVRYKKGIKIFAIVIILTLILSSIKVFPLIEFLNHPQLVSSSLDQDTGFGYNGIGFFKAIVTPPGRYNYQDKIDQNKYYWFEYSMYLGWIGLALIIGGIWVAYKKRASYLITLIITIIISFGENFPINIWKLIHLLPFFESLKVPSRLNIFIIFLLAIFIAESIDYLKKYKWIQILASIALVMSLLLTNISIYKGAFDINPPPVIDAEFSQGINTDTLTTNPLTGWSYEMYSFFLQNKGTINCYEKLRWDTNVEESQVEVDYWSPNKVVVSEETTLNQNFATGWHGENKNDLLVGKDVVYYLPSSFIIGSVITFTVLLISILIFRKKWK